MSNSPDVAAIDPAQHVMQLASGFVMSSAIYVATKLGIADRLAAGPATAGDLGVTDALDPATNLDGGARYLQALLRLYKGDLRKALAAYNAGPGAVARHGGVPPYRETLEYVRKIMKQYGQRRAAEAAR